METDLRVVTRNEEAEKVEEKKINEKDGEIKKEESGNQGDEEERGITLDHFIHKRSP